MTFGEKAFRFLKNLHPDFKLPKDVELLLPFSTKEVVEINKQFYRQFYSDHKQRRLILGINPGRFGAGITGIAFTDPMRLEKELHIQNSFSKKPELSSEFIYHMIHEFGGVRKFYDEFYITSVCPVGFTSNGKNLNYYDNAALEKAAEPFIMKSLTRQIGFGIDCKVVYCLGEGKNFKYLKQLNDREGYFEEIIPLAHPRFIMQYKRKQIRSYIERYLEAFAQ